ncbi:hypothetical protein BN159_5254 [Streptomyces davaonensis JCM 4913]|uniref:Uncharacterized protein n=1 Tax=Streptomyces davaonensis (strain DSM 101723 / JCM 4913 / KCC S-0913 / 768) TaxID=1214101 RepID=K4R8E6_STRDJ|nr:hypothetical protein BN159_5254 [Streptomyces davaonensis JCM 4913]
MPLPRIRLQQRQHHRIIRIPIPSQRKPHNPRQMQIPHSHRIRRPMTTLHHFRRGPRPHPHHGLQPSLRIPRRHEHGLLQPRSNPHTPHNRRRPLVVNPRPMPLPRRNQRPRPSIRHHTHPPGHRPRRRLPVLPHQQPPSPISLIGRDLLLQNRRNQRLHHQPGPRQPQPRPPMPGKSHHAMPRHERRRIIRGPQQRRHPLQQPLRPRPPSLRPYSRTLHNNPQGPRPTRRPTRPPHRPVRHGPKRRIPRPPPQRPEHQPKIERPLRNPRPNPPTRTRTRTSGSPRHSRGHTDMPTTHSRTRGPRRETSSHESGPKQKPRTALRG